VVISAFRERRQSVKAVLYGGASAGLYTGLFIFEKLLAEACSRGGWYFAIPVAIAFAFSIVHGSFTGYFWDVLGVQAKR